MSNNNQRKGTILIAVLVCLGLIGTLIFSAVRVSLQQRRQLDRELQMEQTCLLAQGGLVRAMKLIEAGETDESATFRPNLDSKNTSEVKIEFTDDENRVAVEVTAWIGIEDRPELQTRHQLKKTVKKSVEE